ncbi:MAG: prepilin peptidase [Desulfovibrionaceae bacterium]|nr:prepilin peptidase [Desulfovibrionaceae bacterium]MBF0512876.1 prepilin peptidase [Desulfovibrionaceae bacterium]
MLGILLLDPIFPCLAPVLGLALGVFYGACVRRFVSGEGPAGLAIETASALWALGLALAFGPSQAWLVYMTLGGVFIVASCVDLAELVLPDVLTYPAVVLALAGRILLLGEPASGPLLGAVCGPLFFWLFAAAYRRLRGVEGLGLGDVKLMASLGALAGWRGLPLTIVLGSAAALLASPLLLRGRGKTRAPIPFGPFLCLGAMVCVLYEARPDGLALHG